MTFELAVPPLGKDPRCTATHAPDFANCPSCGDPEKP